MSIGAVLNNYTSKTKPWLLSKIKQLVSFYKNSNSSLNYKKKPILKLTRLLKNEENLLKTIYCRLKASLLPWTRLKSTTCPTACFSKPKFRRMCWRTPASTRFCSLAIWATRLVHCSKSIPASSNATFSSGSTWSSGWPNSKNATSKQLKSAIKMESNCFRKWKKSRSKLYITQTA